MLVLPPKSTRVTSPAWQCLNRKLGGLRMSDNLQRCWHPVCYAEQLASSPVATTLLGDPVVLWRDSSGKPHAFRDLCIHRGTALSLGSVRDDELVCAYHGWRYCSTGACTHIPQLS